MSKLRQVHKRVRNLTEEAATRFVGRLLSLRKRRKVSWLKFGREIGVSPETLLRWRTGRAIPAARASAVCRVLGMQEPIDLEGVDLSGPREFCRALRRVTPLTNLEFLVNVRQVLGYAPVWLASRLVGTALELVPVPWLGDAEHPSSRLMIYGQAGKLLAHFQFEVKDQRLLYSAFSHRVGTAELEFEGVADQLGFDFCLEFAIRQSPLRRGKSVGVEEKLIEGIKKNYERQQRGKEARSGISTAPSGRGVGETLQPGRTPAANT